MRSSWRWKETGRWRVSTVPRTEQAPSLFGGHSAAETLKVLGQRTGRAWQAHDLQQRHPAACRAPPPAVPEEEELAEENRTVTVWMTSNVPLSLTRRPLDLTAHRGPAEFVSTASRGNWDPVGPEKRPGICLSETLPGEARPSGTVAGEGGPHLLFLLLKADTDSACSMSLSLISSRCFPLLQKSKATSVILSAPALLQKTQLP